MRKALTLAIVFIFFHLFSYSHYNFNSDRINPSVMFQCTGGTYTVSFSGSNLNTIGSKYSSLIIDTLNEIVFENKLNIVPNIPTVICPETTPADIGNIPNTIRFFWLEESADNPKAIMGTRSYYVDEHSYTIEPDGKKYKYVNQIRINVYNEIAQKYLTTNEGKEKLKGTIRHEIIHGLGLGHTWSDHPQNAEKKIMYYTNKGDRNSYPEADEENGLLGWYSPARFKKEYNIGTPRTPKVMNLLNGNNVVDLEILENQKSYNVELFYNYEDSEVETEFLKLDDGTYLKIDQCIGNIRHEISSKDPISIEWKVDLKKDYKELETLFEDLDEEYKPFVRMYAENCEDNYHNQQELGLTYVKDKALDTLDFNISKPSIQLSSSYFPLIGFEMVDIRLWATDYRGNVREFAEDHNFQKYIDYVKYDIIPVTMGGKSEAVKSMNIPYSDDTYFNISVPGIFFDHTIGYDITATFYANDVTEITKANDYFNIYKIETNYAAEEKNKSIVTDAIPVLEIDYSKLNDGILQLQSNPVPMNLDLDPYGEKETPTEIKFLYATLEDGKIGEYEEISRSSTFVYDWDLSHKESDKYILKALAKYPSESDFNTKYFTLNPINLTRPINLGTKSMIFKDPRNDPDPNDKNVYGHIDPLDELDTLVVTLPLYDTEEEYWGGVEILKNGELVPDEIYIPKTEPEYIDDLEKQIRTYKFVWNYSEQPEGFVTMHARYKNDILSFSQKKMKVGYAENWDTFDEGMGDWSTVGLTQFAYPPNSGQELHYWRTTENTNIYDVEGFVDTPLEPFTSNDLRTSTANFTSQRYEILSPVIEVPAESDNVQTFLTFDYAREYGSIVTGAGGRSLMVIQVYDESGNNMIEQFYGAMDTKDDVLDEQTNEISHFPIDGSPLNMPNFFEPNNAGLYGDNIWNTYGFWLNWGAAVDDDAYHDYSGQKIRLKFIQYFTNEFAGIVDNWAGGTVFNPGSFILNPPTYTELTYHHFDNFKVQTFYNINLPPVIDPVPDQEMNQHCGWQRIELTGIFDGENSILEDNEDLETQGKSLYKDIRAIKDIEQRADGSLKITAIIQDGKEFKEVTLPVNSKSSEEYLNQEVISVIFESDNKSLLPLDSMKFEEEYVKGDTEVTLLYRPVDTVNGETEITITVTDDGGIDHNGQETKDMKFKVTVLPFNPPDYETTITEFEGIIEDFTPFEINLDDKFTDPEGDEIYYKKSSDDALIDVKLNGSTLSVTSVPDAWGTGKVIIVADDSTGTIPTVIEITIDIPDDEDDLCFSSDYEEQDVQLPVNFGSKSIDIAEQFTSELPTPAVYDVTLSNTGIIEAEMVESVLNLTSIADVTGQVDLTVNVTFDTRVISTQIKVVAGNLSPEIIAKIPNITTDPNFEPIYINLKDHYSDPNKDWLGYSITSAKGFVEPYISFYDDQLVIESKPNISGVDSLFLSIYDGEFTIYDSLVVTIGEVTDPVDYLVTPIEDQHVMEDFGTKTIDLNEHFADPNGDGINYVVSYDNTKVTCEIVDGHLLVVHSMANYHGYSPIMVAIDDGVKEIPEGKFEGCDPKNVITIKEKIKR